MGFLSFIWFFHLSLVQAEGSACFLLFCFPLVRTWFQKVVFYNHNFLLFFCHFPLWPQCVLAIFHHNQCQHLSCITLLFSPCGEVHAVVPHRQPNDVAVCAGLTLETDMVRPQVGVGWEGGYGSGSLLLLFPPPPSPPVSGGSDPVLSKVNSRIWSLASTAVGEKRNVTDWCNTREPTQEVQRSLILSWYHVTCSLSLCLDGLPNCIIIFLSLSIYGKGPKLSLPSSSSPPPELQNKGPTTWADYTSSFFFSTSHSLLKHHGFW